MLPVRGEDCAVSDAFKMGELEQKQLDEVSKFKLNWTRHLFLEQNSHLIIYFILKWSDVFI